jgi:hypothetical protein
MNAMADSFEIPEEFHEVYEVVRTFDLHSKAGHFRIEIVRGLRGGANREFAARYYQETNRGPWTPLSGPGWVAVDNVDTAIHQAMGFLDLYISGAHNHGQA